MSSRVLKKLQGENELELKEQDEQTSDMEIDLAAGNRKKQLNINRYDLLNQHSPSESEVKEDDNETEHFSAANNATICNLSKKKRKKRKKKSSKHSGQQISSEDNEISDKFLNDIDPFLQKANKSPRVTVPESTNDTGKSLLSVEYKNLNPHYEMRRTFGKRVVKIENKRGRPKPMLKSTYLVSVKDSWPPVSKDIIHMVPCSPPEGVIETKNVNWFQFEHSKMYQSVQNMFLSAVEGMDSEFLVHVIKRCPYHVDALIQLSEICKMSESYAVASELIERAVLVLESSLHPTFSLISGNCRLDYRKQENRSFFIALFKHAQYLEDRACCRTAFEISKLILNLDPDTDPLAIVLIIDYYALRSKQYTWLIKFYEELNSVKNLSQLPNMAYSYALALFYSCGDSEEADEALQYALLMFPGVLRPLLDVLSVQTDKRVLAHSYFTPETSNNQSPSLHQLSCLYICRAKNIWRDQSVLPWLERNVNVVLDRVDNKDEIVNEYSQKRAQRYITPPRAILRHVVLSDFKEKVPLAPFVFMEKEPIMMYDPLPPLDSINFYERKAATSTPTIPNSSSLSMFFQSMLPTFNIRAEQNNAAEAAGAAPAGAPADNNAQEEVELNFDQDDGAGAIGAGMQSYRELRSSLNSVVDAMRDFLSSIHITEGTPNHDGDDNESSEEDSSDYSD